MSKKENAPNKVRAEGSAANSTTTVTKIDRILIALKEPAGLNRFEAERLGDHCLNSTVAQLRENGFLIADSWEVVPTRFCPRGVRVKRYRCLGGPGRVTQ